MPIRIQNSDTAGRELGKATMAALSAGLASQAGMEVFGKVVGRVLWKTPTGVTKNTWKFMSSKPMRSVYELGIRGTLKTMRYGAIGSKNAIGGLTRGVWSGGKFILRHPWVTGVGAVGAASLFVAANPDDQQVQRQYESPSIVEAMGGASQYGVSDMMDNMNANGSIVLGLNNRR